MDESLGHLISAAWFAGIAVETLFALNLIRVRLAGRYFAFAAWAIADAVASFLGLAYTTDPQGYLRVYISGAIATTFFQFLAIRSIFSAHLTSYPGIGSFGRKLLTSLILLAVIISVFVIHRDWLDAHDLPTKTLTGVRIVMTAFAVFLAAEMAFFSRYRVPTKTSVLILERGATLNFTIQAIVFFMLLVVGSMANAWGSLLVELTGIATFAYWLVALRPATEFMPLEPVYDPEEHQRIELLNEEALRLADEIRVAVRKRLT